MRTAYRPAVVVGVRGSQRALGARFAQAVTSNADPPLLV
jgi:hypothetical protein